jgi:hypothetical protein
MAAQLMAAIAQAYIYSGEWVADCPRPGCANVEFLWSPLVPNGPRVQPKPLFACSYCGQQAVIEWPPQDFMVEAMAVLHQRPVPDNRNWYPKDHDVATRFRIAHGQTVAQLREENEAHGVTP